MHARNIWVDNAKGIGIVLVVYGHVARGLVSAGLPVDPRLFHLVDSIVYTFHMPLFFFLSGLFFYGSLLKRGPTELVLNKTDSILYPYVIWSLLQGGVEVALSNYTNGSATVGEVLSLAWHPRAQFWFLYALFLVFAVCAFVYAHVRHRYFFALMLVFAVAYVMDRLLPQGKIVGYLLHNAVFFALGIQFNEIKAFFLARRRWLAPLFGAAFVAGQYVFHITFGLSYTEGGWPTLFLAVISIFFVVMLAMCMSQTAFRWLQLLGSSSMAIYLMHILVSSGTRVVLQKFLGVDSIALHLLLGTSLGLALPWLAQAVMRRRKWEVLLRPPQWMSVERLHQRTVAGA